MRKILTVLLAGIMAAVLFVGCNRGTENPNGGSTVKPEDINVNLDPNTTAALEIMVPGGNANERTMIDCLIEDFKDLFPRLDNAEKLRIANLGDISMIVAGEFDEDGSEEYTEVSKDELEFSLKPSIDNAELQGIDNNNITEVQTPINILYVHQSNLSNIKKARKQYSSLKDMKNKIDMELKLNESTR